VSGGPLREEQAGNEKKLKTRMTAMNGRFLRKLTCKIFYVNRSVLVVACWLRAEIEELDPFSENLSTSQGRLKTAVVQFEFAITS
jgi:hypothetical protein